MTSLSLSCYADLIVLDGEASGTFPDVAVAVTDDWLMAPVPESLPEPELQPAIPEPPPVGDLISFTEFDMDVLYAAFDNMGLPNPLNAAGPGGDLSELLADSNELSGEYNGATSPLPSYKVSPRERHSTSGADLKDLELLFVSPAHAHVKSVTEAQASPSPRKTGVRLLSEVEADILSNCNSQSELPRNLAASFEGESVERPVIERKSSDDKKAKPKKFSMPKVKLAVNFSKTPAK